MLRQSIATVLSASALLALVPASASAQNYPQDRQGGYQQGGYGQQNGGGYDRNAFWQGAPDSPRERIDWLQQRIQRGVSDGSLDRREASRSQNELNDIRHMAMRLRARDHGELSPRDRDMVLGRLDNLSQKLHWLRHNGDRAYAPGGQPGGRDQFATNYDASRDYRDDPRYQERRLSSNDQVYRGSDGRYYCKRNDGTTGLIVGAVGGGVLGNVIDGGHNRVAGTLIGGALGALAGKAIDQGSDVRCR